MTISAERFREIISDAMDTAQYSHWGEHLGTVMTSRERDVVRAKWHTMNANTAFIHAFYLLADEAGVTPAEVYKSRQAA